MSGSKVPKVGEAAPAFTLPNQDGKPVKLSDFAGRWLVLYFYPKDNTPGCTIEANQFTEAVPAFEGLEAEVVGVSPDSTRSHQNFIDKQGLKIALLSDPDHKVLEKYGVWQLKKNYGKEYYGVARTTFLIDPKGKIAGVWEAVKAEGHAEAVRQELARLLK